MKERLAKIALLIAFILPAVNSSGQQGMSLMNPMHETFTELKNMELTGDADHDFAAMMLTHHKGSLRMIDEVLKNGKDEAVRSLAERIRENQQNDVRELEKFAGNKGGMQKNDEFVTEMKKHLEKFGEVMDANMELTGNTDKDFLSLMAMHHEHGIDMAKSELKYGRNEELKRLAGKIVTEQEDERKELEELKNSFVKGKSVQ